MYTCCKFFDNDTYVFCKSQRFKRGKNDNWCQILANKIVKKSDKVTFRDSKEHQGSSSNKTKGRDKKDDDFSLYVYLLFSVPLAIVLL